MIGNTLSEFIDDILTMVLSVTLFTVKRHIIIQIK